MKGKCKMKYDFTSILDRRGKDAAAYDNVGAHVIAPARPKEGFDIIPMWVADMNLATVPTVQDALARRIAHPAFGYFRPGSAPFLRVLLSHRQIL